MGEKKIILPEKKLITNPSLADRAVAFINALKHTKGEWHGKPFILLPWQETIIRDVFGTVKENGFRQYNTAYVEIPKKQGKSELAAAVALYLLAGDGEWGAEVYGCAADRQQASIVFDVACQMVEQCPALKKRIKPVLSQKRLVYQPLNSFYQVLSAESYTKHGLNVHGVVFDELHAQPDRRLYDVMTHGSGDARKQPLFFLITTAGTDRNSICWEVHQKAEDILAGRKHDDTFYPVIYGLDDSADWSDEKNWYLANPSLDITVDIDKLRAAYNSAKENPAEENLFRQLRLNQWVKQSVRWMPMDKWDQCDTVVDPFLGPDDEIVIPVLRKVFHIVEILGDHVPEIVPSAVHDGQEVAVDDVVFGPGTVYIVEIGVKLPCEIFRELGGLVVEFVDK